MAMKTTAPPWLSILYIVGLLFIFAGERAFGHLEGSASVITLIGVAMVLGATVWRGIAYLAASSERRRVELITLLCYKGGLLALILYFFTTETGMGILGVGEESAAKFTTAATVMWVLVMSISLIPLGFIEATQGFGRERTTGARAGVDSFRVREMATSGLTIALALAFLMVTCNVATERNIRKDVSYFKTSSPGPAVINTVANGIITDQLKVMMFFPDLNEVGDEAAAYFKELDNEVDGKLDIQRVDRLVSPKLAKENKVSSDGTIVLAYGDKTENIRLTTEIDKARRTELRELDGKVEKALLKVLRKKKIAYLSVGHGELNDPDSAGPLGFNPGLKANHVKTILGALHYQVKNFDGLGKPVPDDADVLIILAPAQLFAEEEQNALDDYLARGGSMLMTLDPQREGRIGTLSGRLGVTFNAQAVTDEKEFMRRRGNPTDRRLILTNQFSSHASITSLSRGSARSGIVFVNTGSFDDAEFTVGGKDGGKDGKKPKRTYVVRSMTTAFRDINDNFKFDKETEKKSRFNLVAAIEDPTAVPTETKEGETSDGMRVVLVADAELFTDAVLQQVSKAGDLFADSVKWLGGEEKFQGTVENEKDVKIEQTKSEEAKSFWTSIVLMPLLILLIGLLNLYFRRRRAQASDK